jgi:hypothetical protein
MHSPEITNIIMTELCKLKHAVVLIGVIVKRTVNIQVFVTNRIDHVIAMLGVSMYSLHWLFDLLMPLWGHSYYQDCMLPATTS